MAVRLCPVYLLHFKPVTFVVKQSLAEYHIFGRVMHSRNPITVGRTDGDTEEHEHIIRHISAHRTALIRINRTEVGGVSLPRLRLSH